MAEPHKRERVSAWRTAIGLQDVDGLRVSEYLKETTVRHIEGDITIDEVREQLRSYYVNKTTHDADDAEKEEADRVAANIKKLLNEQSFSLTWSVKFAMARNPIIYGMASEIFVAQSDDKGGTWSGVIDGLRKKRPIYVRYPDKYEKNANIQLIQKGASAVDINGQILTLSADEQKTSEQLQKEKFDLQIIEILHNVDMISAKDIIKRLNIEWKANKMKHYLENLQQVEKKKIRNRIYYSLKGNKPRGQLFLFDL